MKILDLAGTLVVLGALAVAGLILAVQELLLWLRVRHSRAEFARESKRWAGRALTGVCGHWCWEWDGLPVDETCPEWPCGCFPVNATCKCPRCTWARAEKKGW